MAQRKLGENESLRPGWSEPREQPSEERRLPSLTNQNAINGWIAKASARSGVKFSPGTGKSS
jgi:hypothetical protein